MKLLFSRTFFAPVVLIFSMLSLASCGKEHDLVAEYIVRDVSPTLQLGDLQKPNTPKTTKIPNSPLDTKNITEKSPVLLGK